MKRLDYSILLDTLVRPERLMELSTGEQTVALRQLRTTGLLGWFALRLERLGVNGRCPNKVQDQLLGAKVYAKEHERMLRWEVQQILRALRGLNLEPVLLKGAAYALSGLEIACGRLAADVDILVPKAQLDRVEKALQAHGWESMNSDEYDQSYYRNWMHELPPLRHRYRKTVVDVHHTIVPQTSRLRPDPRLLLEASVALERKGLRVLCPADTLLHKSVHLFYDGDMDNTLRELVDLDSLLRSFGAQEGFWDTLVPRARELGLLRPLYYGLRYTRWLLETPVPKAVKEAARTGRPLAPIGLLMDVLVTSVLVPGDPDKRHFGKAMAGWILYLRSHWLRMPFPLLARHLLVKGFKRAKPKRSDA